jgi:hypothetical protein
MHLGIIKQVTRLAPEMSYDLNDALWVAGNEEVPLHYDLGYKLTAISTIICSFDQSRSGLPHTIIVDETRFASTLEKFLTASSWNKHYPTMLEYVKNDTKQMAPVRRVLWHGKLLFLAGLLVLRFHSHAADYHQFLLDYVEEYNANVLPTCIILKLLSISRDLGLIRCDNEELKRKFLSISLKSFNFPIVLYDLSHHVQRWKYKLKTRQCQSRALMERPDGILDKQSILRWWGAYESIVDGILFNPAIRPPIIYRASFGLQNIGTVTVLLKVLKSILTRSKGPLVQTPSGVEFRKDSHSIKNCKVIARTIGASLFHVGNLGFSFSDAVLDEFYPTNSHGTPLQQCVKRKLEATKLFSIPSDVFKSYTVAPAQGQTHKVMSLFILAIILFWILDS